MGRATGLDFVRGSLELMLLSVLLDGPKYGYLIQKELTVASNGNVNIQAGTLYPLLHKLEKRKLVASRMEKETGRQRKWYRLTAAGKKRLAQQAREWRNHADCLERLLAPVLN